MKKYLLAGGAASLLLLGGTYFVVQSRLEKQIESYLDRMAASLEAQGDGSALTYDEINVQGFSAKINNLKIIDNSDPTLKTNISLEKLKVSSYTQKTYDIEAKNLSFKGDLTDDNVRAIEIQIPDLSAENLRPNPEAKFEVQELELDNVLAKNITGHVYTPNNEQSVANFSNKRLEIGRLEDGVIEVLANEEFEARVPAINGWAKIAEIDASAIDLTMGLTNYQFKKHAFKADGVTAGLGDHEIISASLEGRADSFVENKYASNLHEKNHFKLHLTDAILAEFEPAGGLKLVDIVGKDTLDATLDTAIDVETDQTVSIGFDLDLVDLGHIQIQAKFANLDYVALNKMSNRLASEPATSPQNATPDEKMSEFNKNVMDVLLNVKLAGLDLSIDDKGLKQHLFKLSGEDATSLSAVFPLMLAMADPDLGKMLTPPVTQFLNGSHLELHVTPKTDQPLALIGSQFGLGKKTLDLFNIDAIGK